MSSTDNSDEKSKYDAIFSTEHLRKDLKKRAVNSTAVTLIAQAVNVGLNTASTLILARLLDPDAFGLIALATVSVGIAGVFKEMGLSAATVQRRNITHQQVSNLFWINLTTGLVLTIASIATSPLIAAFLEEPRLKAVISALSISFLFSGCAAQHSAILQRTMQFKAISLRMIYAQIVAIPVGITAALLGWDYWSLVAATLASKFTGAVFLWYASPWRPALPKNFANVKSMTNFGVHLTLDRIFSYLSSKSDVLIIGATLGNTPLGLYTKAYKLLLMPAQNLNSPLSSTVVPALSAIKEDHERYRRFYRNALSSISSISTPFVVFSFFFAEEIILLLLGEKWIASAEVYKYLCPAALAACTNVANSWVYRTWGHVQRQTKTTFINGILAACAIYTGSHWGIIGVAISISTLKVIIKVPFLAICYKDTPIHLADFFAAVWRPIFFASVAATPGFLVQDLLQTLPLFFSVALNFLIFSITYSLTIHFFHGMSESPFQTAFRIVKKKRKTRLPKAEQ